jgi:eukaryotic-like serine/threonine-protein kinase
MPLPAQTVRFGPFQLDRRAAELHHDGTTIKLPEQPFQVLCELIEHPGEIVTREELRQRLWRSDTFVDFEHGLNAAVKRLRELLEDSAERQRYIETLPRRGYRLMVPVEQQPVAAAIPKTQVCPRRLLFAVAAVVVIAAGLVAVVIWRLHTRHVHALTASDTIVLADFSNSTGDPVFDDALKQALTVQLEQSPFLNIVSEARVQDTLRLMKRSADERLTPEVGRDVCQRVGARRYYWVRLRG